jgi:hypothetical protein
MRALLICVVFAAAGQDRQTVTYVYSADGKREAVASTRSAGGRTVEEVAGLNGRPVATETMEEKVLEETPGRKVVERTMMRDGVAAERVRVETETGADGAVVSRTTVYRSDLNGRLAPAERSVREARVAGAVTTTATRVERPGLDGGFELVEKRAGESREEAGGAKESTETVYRRDTSGRFSEAARQVQRQTKDGEALVERTEDYETASTGRMQLAKQTVARTEKTVLGERREVDLYGPAAPGRAAGGGLQFRERQVIERREEATGHSETFSVQRPSLGSARELGPLVKVSETVCRGKCN